MSILQNYNSNIGLFYFVTSVSKLVHNLFFRFALFSFIALALPIFVTAIVKETNKARTIVTAIVRIVITIETNQEINKELIPKMKQRRLRAIA